MIACAIWECVPVPQGLSDHRKMDRVIATGIIDVSGSEKETSHSFFSVPRPPYSLYALWHSHVFSSPSRYSTVRQTPSHYSGDIESRVHIAVERDSWQPGVAPLVLWKSHLMAGRRSWVRIHAASAMRSCTLAEEFPWIELRCQNAAIL
jgi:hypothetical protein